MRTPIYLRRGNKADLPVLLPGEPGFATDTKELFIGATGGNVLLAKMDSGIGQIVSGGYKIQSGRAGTTAPASTGVAKVSTITFPIAFNTSPTVILSLNAGIGGIKGVQAFNETATAFDLYADVATASSAFNCSWIALGT